MLQDFLKEIQLKTIAPLDSEFKPAILFQKKYNQLCQKNGTEEINIALVRSKENIDRFKIKVLKDDIYLELTESYIQFYLKFILWAVGGYKLYYSGPSQWYDFLNIHFSEKGSHQFDIDFMNRIYEKKWIIEKCTIDELPKEKVKTNQLGGHLEGCRVGFDLGASDYKLAAVKNGEVVFTTEIRWDPVSQKDPNYHIEHIQNGLKLAASHLPQVDAIGGSSAGIIHENKIRVASLFRSIPEKDFDLKISGLFNQLKDEWKVPFVTANDGDVSALAGAMSTKDKGILGVAMGSSQAVGYLNQKGEITGQLNELAFAPIDYNPKAAEDEWSKAQGVGVMYFSQQAVNRLAMKAGFKFENKMLLPERLKLVQEKMNQGDKQSEAIFKTIGVYLGYTIPFYAQFYDLNKLMVFGRVLSGLGGDLIIQVAQKILKDEFPDVAKKITLATPDEHFRRVGQAVAAASLAELR